MYKSHSRGQIIPCRTARSRALSPYWKHAPVKPPCPRYYRTARQETGASFKRWSFPGDYDKNRLNRAIDEELAKYPEVLEMYPERKKDTETG